MPRISINTTWTVKIFILEKVPTCRYNKLSDENYLENLTQSKLNIKNYNNRIKHNKKVTIARFGSPFSVSISFLKNKVFTAQIHNTIFQMKLPSVSAPCDLKHLQMVKWNGGGFSTPSSRLIIWCHKTTIAM